MRHFLSPYNRGGGAEEVNVCAAGYPQRGGGEAEKRSRFRRPSRLSWEGAISDQVFEDSSPPSLSEFSRGD